MKLDKKIPLKKNSESLKIFENFKSNVIKCKCFPIFQKRVINSNFAYFFTQSLEGTVRSIK
jgi:hypothetical protein